MTDHCPHVRCERTLSPHNSTADAEPAPTYPTKEDSRMRVLASSFALGQGRNRGWRLRPSGERMTSSYLSSNREYYEYYGLSPDKLNYAKDDALIMHPGPMNRGIEIDTKLADDINKSVIKEQVELGVAVRMACLKIFCA